jgi:hypothetical protein
MKKIANFNRRATWGLSLGDRLKNRFGLITWIDQQPMAGPWAYDQTAVALERSNDQIFLEIHFPESIAQNSGGV